MKQSILDRLKELGGNIKNPKAKSLEEIISSITFDTVLYTKPEDTPWSKAENQEPIYGLGDFVDNNMELFETDKNAFYEKIIETFYCLTEESYGQTFWLGKPFTPFKKGTADFEEWNSDFTDDELVNLQEITKVTKNPESDFIHLFYAYGFPDNIYISLSDPEPENPTLFGTDHTEFFREIDNLGNLEDYLNNFMTKSELIKIVKEKMERKDHTQ